MNFFLPGFFNSINKMPKHILSHIDADTTFDHDTASVSTALLTLLMLITIVEAVILVLCTFYSWFKLPFTDFRWIDDEETDISEHQAAHKAQEDKERFRSISDSLEEHVWNEVHDVECPICLNDFQLNDVVVTAVTNKFCRHVFHKNCLYRWLQIQSTCPCCRHMLINTPPSKETNQIEQRNAMSTTSDGDEDISVPSFTWSQDTRPAYVPFEDAWGFCLFLF